jgi:uncharacterized membrane-anchored protein YitT (DUF2179 family)
MRNSKAFITIFDFVMLTLGAAIAAFAIESFLVPCTILDGGLIGISIMINNLTGVKLGLLTFLLNIPFLLIGAGRIGKLFIVKSAYSMLTFSISLEIFKSMINATHDYLLAVSFGGVILGIGVGLVIKHGGCLDGTETIAILLNRKYNLPVGQTVLIFNILIYAMAGCLFGFDRAMYSLLTYFITSKVLDVVESGIDQTKAAMIITNDAEDISNMIYQRLGRTVTIMEGEGLVSGKKVVLYCVLTRFEIYTLKEIINSIDQSAFVAISDVSEIIGNHIKKNELLMTGSKE